MVHTNSNNNDTDGSFSARHNFALARWRESYVYASHSDYYYYIS